MGSSKKKVDIPPSISPPATSADPTFESSDLLNQLSQTNKAIKLLQEKVEFVTSTNSFILVVLFVGFLALLFSIIGAGIQSWEGSHTSNNQLKESIDILNQHLETSSPTIFPNPVLEKKL